MVIYWVAKKFIQIFSISPYEKNPKETFVQFRYYQSILSESSACRPLGDLVASETTGVAALVAAKPTFVLIAHTTGQEVERQGVREPKPASFGKSASQDDNELSHKEPS